MATLYEKRGRRYLPVAEHMEWDSLRDGDYVVSVRGGRRVVLRAIDGGPAFAALATVPHLTELLCDRLREWSATRPSRPPTPKEGRAWEAYKSVMGEDATLMLTRPAAWEVASGVAMEIARLAKGEGE